MLWLFRICCSCLQTAVIHALISFPWCFSYFATPVWMRMKICQRPGGLLSLVSQFQNVVFCLPKMPVSAVELRPRLVIKKIESRLSLCNYKSLKKKKNKTKRNTVSRYNSIRGSMKESIMKGRAHYCMHNRKQLRVTFAHVIQNRHVLGTNYTPCSCIMF